MNILKLVGNIVWHTQCAIRDLASDKVEDED